jgi:hypothetical protein
MTALEVLINFGVEILGMGVPIVLIYFLYKFIKATRLKEEEYRRQDRERRGRNR